MHKTLALNNILILESNNKTDFQLKDNEVDNIIICYDMLIQ